MTIHHECHITQTEDVVVLTRMLEDGQFKGADRDRAKANLADRKAQLYAGTNWETGKLWTEILCAQLDPLLRVRWDFDACAWMLDRWAQEPYYWVVVGSLGKSIRPDLVEYLRSRDMQAVGANEYLRKKRDAAAMVRRENERKSTEKVMAAVDSLPQKNIDNFIAVERARHTGEKLIHHGPDLKFVEHVEKVQKTTPAIPEDMGPHCMNPGLNPKIYKRKRGGKHVGE